MTSQQQLVCDSSTLANFKQWAQAISNFFSTAGWVQTSDTGQVNWSTIAAVPGSGVYVYEIWKPGDALTSFYVKIEYGNVSSTNCPSLQLSLGTGTNGAGTLTGNTLEPLKTNTANYGAPSSTTQYECDLSGSNNRMCVMMWRNGANNCQQCFCIERSLDATGAYTGAYATLWTIGATAFGSGLSTSQQSLVFAVGAGPISPKSVANSGGLLVRYIANGGSSTAFNGALPFDTAAPAIPYFDYPCTAIGVGAGADFVEGVTFNVTLYAATRTYMPAKTGPFAAVTGTNNGGLGCLCMRYD